MIPTFSYFKVSAKSIEKFNHQVDKFHENNILSLHVGFKQMSKCKNELNAAKTIEINYLFANQQLELK
ncbi:hypothetical protein ATE47_16485 [Chryseobacterium sp. IHB B 17019]|nr:hypothetical protein ATE47_16485 [Chryseobacterium sp. IHB B 17019]